MQKMKGVGSNVVELIELVRSHADAYNKAFIKLEAELKKNEAARDLLAADLTKLQKDRDTAIAEIRTMAGDTLHMVEYKAQNIERLFTEIENVRVLKNNLVDLERSFRQHNFELDSLVRTIKQHTENVVDVEFNKVERKLAAKLALFQEELKAHERQLISFSDYQRREFGILHEDVTNFKSKVSETKYIVDETTRIVENMLEKAEKNIQEKLDLVTSEIERYQNQVSGLGSADTAKRDKGDSAGYDELKIQIRELNQKLRGAETKFASVKFSLYFVGAGMIVVFIMLLLK